MVKGKCNSAPIPAGTRFGAGVRAFPYPKPASGGSLSLVFFSLDSCGHGRETARAEGSRQLDRYFPFPSNSFFNSSIKYFSALLRYVPFL